MNFLSHLYLSGTDEGLIIGNYIADSVKGKEYLNYPIEIQNGILLHRKIDEFTDNHSVVEESKARLRDNYKKYAGVIVDIYYDHYLAINWHHYHETGLQDYAHHIYDLVSRHHNLLPEKSQRFTEYMLRYNILHAYSHIEGIAQVLKGMARRAKFQSNMELAVNDLQEHYQLFEKEFRLFFPDLQAFTVRQLKNW